MIDPPKRVGYRLTYDAQMYYDDWKEYGGCRCFQGNAPCSSCTHEGHPISLEENDEAWELDNEEVEMSRSEITDKGGTKTLEFKSGDRVVIVANTSSHKYKLGNIVYLVELKVSPYSEPYYSTSTTEGGKVNCLGNLYLDDFKLAESADTNQGELCWSTSDERCLPKKQPPQPKKDFVVGKWYKCIDRSGVTYLTAGKWYRCSESYTAFVTKNDYKMTDSYSGYRFDVNSELDYDPDTKESVDTDVEDVVKSPPYTVNTVVTGFTKEHVVFLDNPKFNQQEGVNMSIQRKSVKVELFDNDQGLPVEHSLVGAWDGYVTEDSDSVTVQEIISTGEVADLIQTHNEVRVGLIDEEILTRTGNSVNLRPIKLKNLTWMVDGRKVN